MDCKQGPTLNFKETDPMEGHKDWVTKIIQSPINPDILVSSSRDRTVMVWENTDDSGYVMKTALRGHNHHVTDMTMSKDGNFIITSSSDMTLRLWDLNTQKTNQIYKGHTGPVLSVAFSNDNRQILSGSMDNSIKLWNILGECKHTMDENSRGHQNWVSDIKFRQPEVASENEGDCPIISCSWDRSLKVWKPKSFELLRTITDSEMYLNTVMVSPDGSLFASGGKDGCLRVYDIKYVMIRSVDVGYEINAICFAPSHYWICVAAGPIIKIFNLATSELLHTLDRNFKTEHNISDIKREMLRPKCTSITWNTEGNTIYAGYTDNNIVVWPGLDDQTNDWTSD